MNNTELEKMIDDAIKEVPTNLSWIDGEVWKAWSYDMDKNRYYFDDIGNESLTGLWSDEFLSQAD